MSRKRQPVAVESDAAAVDVERLERQAAWARRVDRLGDAWEFETLAEGYRSGVLVPGVDRWNPSDGAPSAEYVAARVASCRWLSVSAREQFGDVAVWESCFPCKSLGSELCGGPKEVFK